MPETFQRTFTARWADMDFNAHMRNTAYLDYAGDVRMHYFDSHGFSMREFEKRRIGPVIAKDELAYFKEMRLLEAFTVDLQLAGLSDDGMRFRLRNTFYKEDGTKVAVVTSSGVWFDLQERRPTQPPEDLQALQRELVRTDDFDVIPQPKR